jgi:hypothetical protein
LDELDNDFLIWFINIFRQGTCSEYTNNDYTNNDYSDLPQGPVIVVRWTPSKFWVAISNLHIGLL